MQHKSKWIRQNHCLIWPEENFQNYPQSLSNDVVWKLILHSWTAFTCCTCRHRCVQFSEKLAQFGHLAYADNSSLLLSRNSCSSDALVFFLLKKNRSHHLQEMKLRFQLREQLRHLWHFPVVHWWSPYLPKKKKKRNVYS